MPQEVVEMNPLPAVQHVFVHSISSMAIRSNTRLSLYNRKGIEVVEAHLNHV